MAAANKLFKCIAHKNLQCVKSLFNHQNTKKQLIENGEINNVFDYNGGQTLLDIAKEENLNEIVKFLESKGALTYNELNKKKLTATPRSSRTSSRPGNYNLTRSPRRSPRGATRGGRRRR